MNLNLNTYFYSTIIMAKLQGTISNMFFFFKKKERLLFQLIITIVFTMKKNSFYIFKRNWLLFTK